MAGEYTTIIFDWSRVCTIGGISDSISQAIADKAGLDKAKVRTSLKKVEDDYITGHISGKEFLQRILDDTKVTANPDELLNTLIVRNRK